MAKKLLAPTHARGREVIAVDYPSAEYTRLTSDAPPTGGGLRPTTPGTAWEDVTPSASAAQPFKIADLLIPSGSDLHGAFNEKQDVDFGTSSDGSVTLTFDGETTTAISYAWTDLAIVEALEALPNIGAGNVSLTDGLGNDAIIEFIGDLAGQPVSLMTMDTTDLVNPGAAGITRVQAGAPATSHEIGRFTMQAHEILAAGGAYLEIDAPIGDIQLHLGAGFENDPPNLADDTDLFASTYLGAGDGLVVSRQDALSNPVTFVAAAPREIVVVLYTNGPTSADITVVLGRAVFLVI